MTPSKKTTTKKTVEPAPAVAVEEPTVEPPLFRARDKITREMVKDLAQAGQFHEIRNALYAYGIWLEYTPEAFGELTHGPTNRTFTCQWPADRLPARLHQAAATPA